MTSFTLLCRVAACLAAALFVVAHAAEPARKAADPADPNATVPATRYRPALPYRTVPPQQGPAADQNWKALNQTVGAINSMSLTMGGADQPAQAEPAQQDGHQHAHAAAPAPMQHHHHHEMKQ